MLSGDRYRINSNRQSVSQGKLPRPYGKQVFLVLTDFRDQLNMLFDDMVCGIPCFSDSVEYVGDCVISL